MSNTATALAELRCHYERIVVQSKHQAEQAKAQLKQIDALLLSGLLQGEMQTLNAVMVPEQPALALAVAIELDEEEEDSLSQAKPSPSREAKASPAAAPVAQGNRIPRPLLPAYQGLKRLEAIAQVLQSAPDLEMTTDRLISALFGTLSPAEHKAERLKLKTLLYQGKKLGRWQKGTTLSSYRSSAPHPTEKLQSAPVAIAKPPTPSQTKAPAAKGNAAISLLPAYAGMNKLEAIAQVLTEQSGHVLHQDAIFQLLYGEVGPEVLSNESKRMRASLFQGVTKGLWEKASNRPSSYLVKASNGRQPKASANAKAEGVSSSIVAGEPKPPSATQAKASTSAKIAQLEPATPKKPRKAAPAKTTAKPKRKQAEVVALLKKANIKV
jgi:hypothetical protein